MLEKFSDIDLMWNKHKAILISGTLKENQVPEMEGGLHIWATCSEHPLRLVFLIPRGMMFELCYITAYLIGSLKNFMPYNSLFPFFIIQEVSKHYRCATNLTKFSSKNF